MKPRAPTATTITNTMVARATHWSCGHPTDERGGRAEIARHLTVDDEQEADGGDATHQDGQLWTEPHDDGEDERRAEHRDHVLGAQPDRPRPGQALIGADHLAGRRCLPAVDNPPTKRSHVPSSIVQAQR